MTIHDSPPASSPVSRPVSRAASTARSAADFLPPKISLPTLISAARKCQGCDLYCHATQTVFGEGPLDARFFLVGEQPGDQEDRTGKPFVGPAGTVLNRALAAAGIDRAAAYVTNAVKHFKWEPRGKRRIHAKPSSMEIVACRPWLLEELNLIAPKCVITLGATAAQSLLGRTFRLTQHRQEILRVAFIPHIAIVATLHPSSILRIPDPALRHAAEFDLIADLQFASAAIPQ